jgi:hypothetical protein
LKTNPSAQDVFCNLEEILPYQRLAAAKGNRFDPKSSHFISKSLTLIKRQLLRFFLARGNYTMKTPLVAFPCQFPEGRFGRRDRNPLGPVPPPPNHAGICHGIKDGLSLFPASFLTNCILAADLLNYLVKSTVTVAQLEEIMPIIIDPVAFLVNRIVDFPFVPLLLNLERKIGY